MALSIEDKVDVLEALHYVRAKWRPIGLCVRVKDGDLDAIEIESGDAQRKLEGMVTRWLKQGENCTWSALAVALRSVLVGEPEVAKQIEQQHCGGVCQVQLDSPATSAPITVDSTPQVSYSSAISLPDQSSPLIAKKVCTSLPFPSIPYNAISNASSLSRFSWELEQKGLISSQVRSNVETTAGYSFTEKFTRLLGKIEFCNPNAFDTLLEVLHSNPALSPFADVLAEFHGKLMV